jgi:two-component system nitrogen regulation response regulator NtrX
LRDRKEDIPLLVKYFTDAFSRENNFKPRRFSPAALNTVERLVIMAPGDTIDAPDVRAVLRVEARAGNGNEPREKPGTLREFKEMSERAFLVEKLRENGWNISKTAEVIGTPRSNLYKKLEQYEISQDVDG